MKARCPAVLNRVAGQDGVALVVAILVIALIGSLVAAAISGAMGSLRSAVADYEGARVFYAAEAGAEAALSQLEVAIQDGILEPGELASIQPPALEGFDYDGFEVQLHGEPVTEPISDGPFAGLYSLTQRLDITSRARSAANAEAAVILGAKAQAIPIFQFAVFFQGSMEDYAGSRKDILGRVHANGDIFFGARDLHFHEVVTTPNRVHRDARVAPHPNPGSIHIFLKDAENQENELTFDSDDTPDPEQFKQKSERDFDSRLKTNAFGVDSLKLPLPDGVPLREVIRPRDEMGEESDAELETKFAWKADMYVTVDLGNVQNKNAACGGNPPPPHEGTPSHLPTITVERPFGGPEVDDATKCWIFRWRWESFFDYAEMAWVDVLDLDIAQLRQWQLDNPDGTRLIYIEFANADADPSPGSTDDANDAEDNCEGRYCPVLRITNGAELPGPLTVGSEYPLFVHGDYNTVDWKPSSLFGDRLAALSNAWTDGKALRPAAAHTDQYFAVITGTGEGYVGCYYADPEPGCQPLPEGRGPAGWVKLLENWNAGCGSRCRHTFVGSFVTLWAPQIASPYGNFPGADYYKRPERDYRFDERFKSPTSLPPGTPVVGQVFRASFREAF